MKIEKLLNVSPLGDASVSLTLKVKIEKAVPVIAMTDGLFEETKIAEIPTTGVDVGTALDYTVAGVPVEDNAVIYVGKVKSIWTKAPMDIIYLVKDAMLVLVPNLSVQLDMLIGTTVDVAGIAIGGKMPKGETNPLGTFDPKDSVMHLDEAVLSNIGISASINLIPGGRSLGANKSSTTKLAIGDHSLYNKDTPVSMVITIPTKAVGDISVIKGTNFPASVMVPNTVNEFYIKNLVFTTFPDKLRIII